MSFFDLKKKVEKAKPIVVRGLGGAVQGYVFGCVVGLFTRKRNPDMKMIIRDVHSSGKKFGSVGALYSTTEALLDEFQGKRAVNSVFASAVSGAISQKASGKKSMVTTAALFTIYNSAYQLYGFK